MVEFDLRTNEKELEKNLKLQRCASDLHDKFKEVVSDYLDVVCHYRLTH